MLIHLTSLEVQWTRNRYPVLRNGTSMFVQFSCVCFFLFLFFFWCWMSETGQVIQFWHVFLLILGHFQLINIAGLIVSDWFIPEWSLSRYCFFLRKNMFLSFFLVESSLPHCSCIIISKRLEFFFIFSTNIYRFRALWHK